MHSIRLWAAHLGGPSRLGASGGNMNLIDDWQPLVERLDGMSEEDAILGLFNNVLMQHGGEYLQIGELGPILTSDAHCVGNFPPEWSARYCERNYWKSDPAFIGAIQGRVPARWSEIRFREHEAGPRLILEEAKEHGLADGWTIPIFQMHGYKAVLSICAPEFDRDPRVLPILHMMAVFVHGRILNVRQAFDSMDRAFAVNKRSRPSSREVECLKWVTAGKSDWEIGEILGISDRTVHKHVESAKSKFGVPTRLQAVVCALRQGIISLW